MRVRRVSSSKRDPRDMETTKKNRAFNLKLRVGYCWKEREKLHWDVACAGVMQNMSRTEFDMQNTTRMRVKERDFGAHTP